MKKKLLISAIAVCLVALIAFGSLAYFTDSSEVTNVFKATSTDPDNPDQELFDIDVIEHDPETGDPTDEGITYEDIAPGDVLSKDPTVENNGVYGAYVRVSVTVTEASAWAAICEKWDLDLEDIFGGYNADFERKDIIADEDADTLTYVYYLNKELAAGESACLFETVTIPACLDNDDMASIADFDLTVSADAIQSANTGDNAYDAFANYWN